MQLEVRRLRPDAVLPARMSESAAGLDLAAALDTPIALAPGARVLVPTGIAIAVPEGFEAQVRPRSGLALKHGITCLNSPGTVDADYRGELKVILINHGQEPFRLEHGMRIAQLVVVAVAKPVVVEVTELPPTLRGAGGFGSTGS